MFFQNKISPRKKKFCSDFFYHQTLVISFPTHPITKESDQNNGNCAVQKFKIPQKSKIPLVKIKILPKDFLIFWGKSRILFFKIHFLHEKIIFFVRIFFIIKIHPWTFKCAAVQSFTIIYGDHYIWCFWNFGKSCFLYYYIWC